LKAKLQIETSDLSKDKINSLLQEKGVEDHVIKEFGGILESCELARYTPIDIVTMQDDYEPQLTSCLLMVGQKQLLLLCLALCCYF